MAGAQEAVSVCLEGQMGDGQTGGGLDVLSIHDWTHIRCLSREHTSPGSDAEQRALWDRAGAPRTLTHWVPRQQAQAAS